MVSVQYNKQISIDLRSISWSIFLLFLNWFVNTSELQVLHEMYPYTFTVSLIFTVQCINKQIKIDLRSISSFVSYFKAYLIWK